MAGIDYQLDFGIGNAGLVPGFLLFIRADTNAPLVPQPAIVPIRSDLGVFEFTLDWTAYPAGIPAIFFKATADGTVNGSELSDTIPFTGIPTTIPAGAGSKSLADARAEVLEALKEKVNAKGLVPSEAALDRWINRANRWAWNKGVQRNPDAWKTRAPPATFPSAAGVLALDQLCGVAPRSVHLLQVLDGSNTWKTVDARESADRPTMDRAPTPPVTRIPYGWYTEGGNLYLTPVPQRDWQVRATFTGLLARLTNDADALLANRFGDHHDLVVYKTCQLMTHKGEGSKTPWDGEVDDSLRDFITALRRSQGQHSRRIRRTSHY
jgi:hypothetical protein